MGHKHAFMSHQHLLCSLLLVDMNTNMKQEDFSEYYQCILESIYILTTDGNNLAFGESDDVPRQLEISGRTNFFISYIGKYAPE